MIKTGLLIKAGSTSQWWGTCLASIQTWAQTSSLPESEKENKIKRVPLDFFYRANAVYSTVKLAFILKSDIYSYR